MGSSIGAALGKTIYFVFVMGLILFLAYIVTRFIGSKYMKTLKGRNINVLESVSLGVDKVLFLVKVGTQYMLISSSGKNINLISEIKPENVNINQISEGKENVLDSNTFAKYFDVLKNKISNQDINEEQEDIQQTYQAAKVDKNVDKMRDLFNSIKVSDKDGVE